MKRLQLLLVGSHKLTRNKLARETKLTFSTARELSLIKMISDCLFTYVEAAILDQALQALGPSLFCNHGRYAVGMLTCTWSYRIVSGDILQWAEWQSSNSCSQSFALHNVSWEYIHTHNMRIFHYRQKICVFTKMLKEKYKLNWNLTYIYRHPNLAVVHFQTTATASKLIQLIQTDQNSPCFFPNNGEVNRSLYSNNTNEPNLAVVHFRTTARYLSLYIVHKERDQISSLFISEQRRGNSFFHRN